MSDDDYMSDDMESLNLNTNYCVFKYLLSSVFSAVKTRSVSKTCDFESALIFHNLNFQFFCILQRLGKGVEHS